MRKRPPKVGTLADLATHRHDLSVWCRSCRHSGGVLRFEDLIARFGADASCEAVCRALRCNECGARDADFNLSVRAAGGYVTNTAPVWGRDED